MFVQLQLTSRDIDHPLGLMGKRGRDDVGWTEDVRIKVVALEPKIHYTNRRFLINSSHLLCPPLTRLFSVPFGVRRRSALG